MRCSVWSPKPSLDSRLESHRPNFKLYGGRQRRANLVDILPALKKKGRGFLGSLVWFQPEHFRRVPVSSISLTAHLVTSRAGTLRSMPDHGSWLSTISPIPPVTFRRIVAGDFP